VVDGVGSVIDERRGPHDSGAAAQSIDVDAMAAAAAASRRAAGDSTWGRWPRRSAVRAVAVASHGPSRGGQGNAVVASPVWQRARTSSD
jgi:hypothetical protein